MELFLFFVYGLFLAARTVLFDFHPIRMELLVPADVIVLFLAVCTHKNDLRSHRKTSIQSLIYFMIKDLKMQAQS